MKQKIDLKDPFNVLALNFYNKKIQHALNVFPKIENAILPIFTILESDPKNKNIPQQIGTGVVVTIKNEYFIFSASHVFDDIGNKQLLIAAGETNEVIPIPGERFSSKKGSSDTHEDDPVDASVYHLQTEISERLKKIALTLDDFDWSEKLNDRSIYFPSGFRVSQSKRRGNIVNSKQEVFPTVEILEQDYKKYNLDPDINIALAYEKETIIKDRWHLSPKLNGISGGPIIRIDGVNLELPSKDIKDCKQLLTAITIGQQPEKHGKPGILIGTRVIVHLGLIDQFLPGLIDYKEEV
ncbi:hypothetical protein [Chryseobacterium viscerum]|uniref:Serine protease n=1 Tax=Chryseobacterium viscerum TaxID=1037377 RepID=A0A5N4BPW5_9FLAO|nr:hypothetical protein [Chryseobacterium viscerum]KAB1230471.1 hypothetical protein F8D52_11955 [Chryseobacterium viscerum]